MTKEGMTGLEVFTTSLSEIDIAYGAGLFEGEGWVRQHKEGRSWAWAVGITMTDREPLERMLKFGGKITGPYHRNSPEGKIWKDSYRWYLYGYRNTLEFYNYIKNFLCPRRLEQFRAALAKTPKEYAFGGFSCGINSRYGYDKHWHDKETPCLSCRIAHTKYQWERTHPGEIWSISSKMWSRYGELLKEVNLVPHG